MGGRRVDSGYLGATAQIRLEGTCGQAQILYLTDEGEQFDDPKAITRGIACLDECSNPFERIAVPCPDTEDPCAGL